MVAATGHIDKRTVIIDSKSLFVSVPLAHTGLRHVIHHQIPKGPHFAFATAPFPPDSTRVRSHTLDNYPMADSGKAAQVLSERGTEQESKLTTPTKGKGKNKVEVDALSTSSSTETLVQDDETEVPKTNGSTAEKDPEAAAAKKKKKSSKSSKKEGKKDHKVPTGWLNRDPFRIIARRTDEKPKKYVHWNELTISEKYLYRKQFLFEYLRETRACLPHVKRLFLAIYRISPWRAMALLALNVVNGLVPAMTLKNQGRFIILVYLPAFG
jgi:hypothetical protein